MTTPITRRSALAAVALVAGLAPAPAQQAYPNKTVRMIVPFPPGGASDLVARIVADKLSTKWGQSVVIENLGGAGSNIGVSALARATPDGYTIGLINSSSHGANKALYKDRLPFDPVKDFAPVTQMVLTPNVVVVNPAKVPAKTLAELVAYAKANPGKLNFGSSGVGSSLHVGMEMLQEVSGTKMNHVPYRGSGPMMTDLLAGQVDLAMDGAAVAWPHVESGKLRAIAISTPNRAPFLADLPALSETYPGFDVTAWHGLAAPAGTPKAIVDTVSADVREILASPEIKSSLESKKIIALGMTPEAFSTFIAGELKKWTAAVEKAGVTAE